MPGIFPPIQSPMRDGDEPRVTKGWESFFADLYGTMGGLDGAVFFEGNEVKVDGIGKDLTIGSGTDTISLNGFAWPAVIESGKVLVTDTNQALSFVTPDEVFTVYETGDVIHTYAILPTTGWIKLDDGTIGNGSSAATSRADSDTEDLFTELWTNMSDTYAPVSSGRGASAAADYAANKTITLPKIVGRSIGASGTGSGLTARSLGFSVGENDHVLTTAEMPTHGHPVPTGELGAGDGLILAPVVGPVGASSFSVGTANAGSGTAHETMQPHFTTNAMIKL